MNTKYIMAGSAIFLALLGISLSFFPAELLSQFNLSTLLIQELALQVLGACYLGFAALNWTAKGSLIGGIYNRPVLIANLMHFVVGGLSLLKGIISNPDVAVALMIVAVLYLIFSVSFGIMMFRHPIKN